MTPFERLNADLSTQSHTSGPHPMKLLRKSLPSLKNTHRAIDLKNGQHRQPIKIGGLVICRQRPGTAKGHCFISLEDETGIANIFVPKTTFQLYRLTITTEPFLLIHGDIQIGEANTISIYTHHIEPLKTTTTLPKNISHDFH